MNTNSNVYTIVYTTIVVVIVSAALAFVSMKLGPSQEANAKAETLRQMMTAAQIAPAEKLYASGNAEVLSLYANNISEALTGRRTASSAYRKTISSSSTSSSRRTRPSRPAARPPFPYIYSRAEG